MTSGLFANQREVNLTSTIAMIEDVLVELGYFLNQCRDDRDGAIRSWKIKHGSAHVRISLIAAAQFTHLRIEAPVMTIAPDADRAGLFGRLLETNMGLCGAAFGLREDRVEILAERSTLDLDRSEVMEIVARVQGYADEHDDALVAAFGGALATDV
jgi:hypothetical protein